MMGLRDRGVMLVVVLGLAAVLSACGSKVVNRAPIEERMPVVGGSAGVAG